MAGNAKRSTRFTTGMIGLVVIVVLAITAVYALNSSKGLPFLDRTYVTAQFTDIGDLRVGQDLREADFRVGRVNSIEYNGAGVGTVRAQFNDTRPVYRNAHLTVIARSGLGQKYLNIDRGDPSAGELGPDEIIPVTQTDPSVEILDLADVFDPKTTRATRSTLGALGAGLEGNGEALSQAVNAVPGTLPKLGIVTRALNNDNGQDINTLLGSLRSLSARFEGRRQQIADLNRQLATTLDAVNVDDGRALSALLKTAPPAFRDVRKALVDLRRPLAITQEAVTNIRPGVRDLATSTPDVRGVLREAPRPLDKVPGVSEVGQPALKSLTPAARDLRPLVPKIRRSVENARHPLTCLAAYADQVGGWFTTAARVISQGDGRGNWARFTVVPTTGSVVNVPETNATRNVPCPAPDFGDHGGSTKGEHQ